MADQEPVFQIQRVYLKEASMEQPNSPAILLEQAQPAVDINLAMAAATVADTPFHSEAPPSWDDAGASQVNPPPPARSHRESDSPPLQWTAPPAEWANPQASWSAPASN